MPNESRNTLLFIVISVVILFGYQFLVLGPQNKRHEAERAAAAAAAKQQAPTGQLGAPGSLPGDQFVSRAQALAATPRVPVQGADLTGSLSLKGARFDDLYLRNYHETPDPKSPMVELFRPAGAQFAYFAELGWTGPGVAGLPGDNTVWTAPAGAVLKPGSPVVLTYDNGHGLLFARRIEVDDRYMFTITDTVANNGTTPVTLAPYGSVQRQGVPADLGKTQIIHEGAIGVMNDQLKLAKYKKWKKEGLYDFQSTGGWMGITDKYWLAALIPAQTEAIHSQFKVTPASGVDVNETNFVGAQRTIAPGAQSTEVTHLFAGAKTVPVLKDYEKTLNVPRLEDAVDWGMFWFFTKPLFNILEFFYRHIANFGLAILALTITVKLVFFPLANKSYESMTKMKKVQPELDKIKKRNEKDPAKQQQEMMALYAKEKINPFMGCLPMLIQIPVFYSLYKVLTVTIEMRHAPFYGWIHDLSARDPTTIWTLFGLIPWHPAMAPVIGGMLDQHLHIGIWPIIMGATMWLQQTMSPPAGVDPIQQRIFQFLPLVLMFTLSQVAAGLVIYWSWNNVLSILQQYVIMHRFKVDNPIDDFIARITGKPKPSARAG